MTGFRKLKVTTERRISPIRGAQKNRGRTRRGSTCAASRAESVERRGRAEELVTALRLGHAERLQMLLHCLHERLRAEEIGIHIAVLRQPRVEQLFVPEADAMRFITAVALVRVAVKALELRRSRRQFRDDRTERMHAAVSRRVDE